MPLLGVTEDEIRAINAGFGGTVQMNSTVETVFLTAHYVDSFWEKVAVVVRGIAGGHLFDNGNKRTAFESVRLFQRRNQIATGTGDATLRETVRLVALKQLEATSIIARRLRGF